MATDHTAPIRILIANLSDLLTQFIIEMVDQQPQMQIVGQVQGQLEILIAAQKGVDMVILGTPHLKPVPGIVSHMMNEFPNMKILVLSTIEGKGKGYWLGIHHCRIEYSTADTLQDSIHSLFKKVPSA